MVVAIPMREQPISHAFQMSLPTMIKRIPISALESSQPKNDWVMFIFWIEITWNKNSLRIFLLVLKFFFFASSMWCFWGSSRVLRSWVSERNGAVVKVEEARGAAVCKPGMATGFDGSICVKMVTLVTLGWDRYNSFRNLLHSTVVIPTCFIS